MTNRMNLVEIRRMRGYSQEYMAKALNCHRLTYAKMEEHPETITMANADIIANLLNVSINDIIFLKPTLQIVE